jgi:hypothetical protein
VGILQLRHSGAQNLLRFVFTCVIAMQEPPREGEEEVESLRRLMAHLGHDEELDTHRAMITRQVTDSIFRDDLFVISRQLQHLIDELATPANYGDNLLDAQANMDNFKRFETTAQVIIQLFCDDAW